MSKKTIFVLRLKAVLLWTVAFMFLVLVICYVCQAPQLAWNDARLAPVAAWLRGYPLYTPENSGVIIGNFYPPLGALAFLPAGLIGHPVPAIITGSILSLLMNFSPAVGAMLLCFRELQKSTEILLTGSILYLGLLLVTEGPNFTLFAIHVDAPAIALMLWGVIFYAKWWASGTSASLAISAFLLASVVWAKQVGVPLPFAFLIATMLIGGARSAVVFSAWSLATLGFWILALTPIVRDWHAFFYDIWTIPAGHPWRDEVTGGELERLRLFLAESVSFLRHYWLLYLLVFAATLALDVCSKQSGAKPLRLSFALAASSLIASLTMLPFSLLGLVKVGGNVNASAFSIQPLLLGLVIGGLGLVEVARRAGPQWNVVAQSIICACLVAFIATLRPGREILGYPLNVATAPPVTAYQQSKDGNVWFPEFPLSSLLATGRPYHHSYSVHAIFLARKTVSPRQLAEGIPQAPFTLKYLRDDREGVEAEKMLSYLGIPPDSLSDAKVGPWQQVLVQQLPRP